MTRNRLLIALIPLVFAAGCDRPADPADTDPATRPILPTTPASPAGSEPVTAPAPVGTPPATEATAPAALARIVLQPTQGNTATGELVLVADTDGARLTGHVRGLRPDAEHGFHIHEYGDCSAADASSAGGHFSPEDQPHGRPGEGPHHAGDMPNLRSDAQGEAHVDLHLGRIELGTGSPLDAADRAIVVHQQADDYETQPTGDSGARIACGVITLAQS
jgi:superoxide dismutase, Cu-Zn family